MIITLLTLYLFLSYLTGLLFQHSFYPGFNPALSTLLSLLVPMLLFVPIADLPLYSYIIALTGYLSVSGFFMVSLSVLQQKMQSVGLHKPCISYKEKKYIYSILACTGLLFYPMALGFSQFDPYTLGYWYSFPINYYLVLPVLAIICLVCAYLNYYYLPVIIALSLASYYGLPYPSYNWWDHFMDPWIWFYACYFLIRSVRK